MMDGELNTASTDLKIRNSIFRIIISDFFIGFAMLLRTMAKSHPRYVTEVYQPISIRFMAVWSSLFSVFPYSFAEFAIPVLILAVLVTLIMALTKWRKRYGMKALLCWVSWIITVVSLGYLFFIGAWGLNYYAEPLAEQLEIEEVEPTRERLYEAADYYLEKLNQTEVTRREDGTFDCGDFSDLAEKCADCYTTLSDTYPRFRGGYSPAKAVTSWRLMSKTHITGIFCPFTGECNVNPDNTDANLPFTIAHEAAHRLAVCPENEANFAALLACRSSHNVEYQYSGWYSGFIYLYNAVSKVDSEKQSELWNGLEPGPLADVMAAIEHYKKNEGKVADTAEKVNDTYLKSMNQTDGVESYGQVVDLIISDYFVNIKETSEK